MQLLEVEFVSLLESLTKSSEPVREVMSWADKCCDRLMGGNRAGHAGEDRGAMSSRSVLIRWGYVTSQVMRDLVSLPFQHLWLVYFCDTSLMRFNQTIRSDPAFGAFQILKLFLEYVSFIFKLKR